MEIKMEEKIEIGFLDHFETLEDPRSERNKIYPMSEVLLTTICALLSGAEGWQDIEDFGKTHLDYLKRFLNYENDVPSDDTYRRFFRGVNVNHFQELFRNWMKEMFHFEESVIAIDGKSSRHSFDSDKKMLHMISAYATDVRLVLAQEKVDEKSNEITAIPKILEWLDLKNNVVTIDAMGCQHVIAEKIIEKEGNYVFSLKGNQGELHKDIREYVQDQSMLQDFFMYQDFDKGHGRIEKRTCWVSNDVAWLHIRNPQWTTIKSIIRIDSVRDTNSKSTSESRFYISSAIFLPEKFLRIIRSHWAIENSLHWILDMVFAEDSSRIRKDNAPQVMAILRHFSLNLLRLAKQQYPRLSFRRMRRMAGWNHELLSTILRQRFS